MIVLKIVLIFFVLHECKHVYGSPIDQYQNNVTVNERKLTTLDKLRHALHSTVEAIYDYFASTHIFSNDNTLSAAIRDGEITIKLKTIKEKCKNDNPDEEMIKLPEPQPKEDKENVNGNKMDNEDSNEEDSQMTVENNDEDLPNLQDKLVDEILPEEQVDEENESISVKFRKHSPTILENNTENNQEETVDDKERSNEDTVNSEVTPIDVIVDDEGRLIQIINENVSVDEDNSGPTVEIDDKIVIDQNDTKEKVELNMNQVLNLDDGSKMDEQVNVKLTLDDGKNGQDLAYEEFTTPEEESDGVKGDRRNGNEVDVTTKNTINPEDTTSFEEIINTNLAPEEHASTKHTSDGITETLQEDTIFENSSPNFSSVHLETEENPKESKEIMNLVEDDELKLITEELLDISSSLDEETIDNLDKDILEGVFKYFIKHPNLLEAIDSDFVDSEETTDINIGETTNYDDSENTHPEVNQEKTTEHIIKEANIEDTGNTPERVTDNERRNADYEWVQEPKKETSHENDGANTENDEDTKDNIPEIKVEDEAESTEIVENVRRFFPEYKIVNIPENEASPQETETIEDMKYTIKATTRQPEVKEDIKDDIMNVVNTEYEDLIHMHTTPSTPQPDKQKTDPSAEIAEAIEKIVTEDDEDPLEKYEIHEKDILKSIENLVDEELEDHLNMHGKTTESSEETSEAPQDMRRNDEQADAHEEIEEAIEEVTEDNEDLLQKHVIHGKDIEESLEDLVDIEHKDLDIHKRPKGTKRVEIIETNNGDYILTIRPNEASTKYIEDLPTVFPEEENSTTDIRNNKEDTDENEHPRDDEDITEEPYGPNKEGVTKEKVKKIENLVDKWLLDLQEKYPDPKDFINIIQSQLKLDQPKIVENNLNETNPTINEILESELHPDENIIIHSEESDEQEDTNDLKNRKLLENSIPKFIMEPVSKNDNNETSEIINREKPNGTVVSVEEDSNEDIIYPNHPDNEVTQEVSTGSEVVKEKQKEADPADDIENNLTGLINQLLDEIQEKYTKETESLMEDNVLPALTKNKSGFKSMIDYLALPESKSNEVTEINPTIHKTPESTLDSNEEMANSLEDKHENNLKDPNDTNDVKNRRLSENLIPEVIMEPLTENDNNDTSETLNSKEPNDKLVSVEEESNQDLQYPNFPDKLKHPLKATVNKAEKETSNQTESDEDIANNLADLINQFVDELKGKNTKHTQNPMESTVATTLTEDESVFSDIEDYPALPQSKSNEITDKTEDENQEPKVHRNVGVTDEKPHEIQVNPFEETFEPKKQRKSAKKIEKDLGRFLTKEFDEMRGIYKDSREYKPAFGEEIAENLEDFFNKELFGIFKRMYTTQTDQQFEEKHTTTEAYYTTISDQKPGLTVRENYSRTTDITDPSPTIIETNVEDESSLEEENLEKNVPENETEFETTQVTREITEEATSAEDETQYEFVELTTPKFKEDVHENRESEVEETKGKPTVTDEEFEKMLQNLTETRKTAYLGLKLIDEKSKSNKNATENILEKEEPLAMPDMPNKNPSVKPEISNEAMSIEDTETEEDIIEVDGPTKFNLKVLLDIDQSEERKPDFADQIKDISEDNKVSYMDIPNEDGDLNKVTQTESGSITNAANEEEIEDYFVTEAADTEDNWDYLNEDPQMRLHMHPSASEEENEAEPMEIKPQKSIIEETLELEPKTTDMSEENDPVKEYVTQYRSAEISDDATQQTELAVSENNIDNKSHSEEIEDAVRITKSEEETITDNTPTENTNDTDKMDEYQNTNKNTQQTPVNRKKIDEVSEQNTTTTESYDDSTMGERRNTKDEPSEKSKTMSDKQNTTTTESFDDSTMGERRNTQGEPSEKSKTMSVKQITTTTESFDDSTMGERRNIEGEPSEKSKTMSDEQYTTTTESFDDSTMGERRNTKDEPSEKSKTMSDYQNYKTTTETTSEFTKKKDKNNPITNNEDQQSSEERTTFPKEKYTHVAPVTRIQYANNKNTNMRHLNDKGGLDQHPEEITKEAEVTPRTEYMTDEITTVPNEDTLTENLKKKSMPIGNDKYWKELLLSKLPPELQNRIKYNISKKKKKDTETICIEVKVDGSNITGQTLQPDENEATATKDIDMHDEDEKNTSKFEENQEAENTEETTEDKETISTEEIITDDEAETEVTKPDNEDKNYEDTAEENEARRADNDDTTNVPKSEAASVFDVEYVEDSGEKFEDMHEDTHEVTTEDTTTTQSESTSEERVEKLTEITTESTEEDTTENEKSISTEGMLDRFVNHLLDESSEPSETKPNMEDTKDDNNGNINVPIQNSRGKEDSSSEVTCEEVSSSEITESLELEAKEIVIPKKNEDSGELKTQLNCTAMLPYPLKHSKNKNHSKVNKNHEHTEDNKEPSNPEQTLDENEENEDDTRENETDDEIKREIVKKQLKSDGNNDRIKEDKEDTTSTEIKTQPSTKKTKTKHGSSLKNEDTNDIETTKKIKGKSIPLLSKKKLDRLKKFTTATSEEKENILKKLSKNDIKAIHAIKIFLQKMKTVKNSDEDNVPPEPVEVQFV